MLQKPRMPQIQGVKGEAVLRYAGPLRTQEMRYHTDFPKGKNRAIFLKLESTLGEFQIEDLIVPKIRPVSGLIHFGPVFYATFGKIGV
jgi:hypothetical protein